MAIQNDDTLVTKGDLKSLYSNKIAPYLGVNMVVNTNNSDYYSTEEKVVGVWTDGRPLYQKTWTGTVSFNSGTQYDLITSLPANIDDNYSWVDDSASFLCTYPGLSNSGTRQSGFTYGTSYVQMWLASATTIRFRCDNMGNGTNIPYVCTLKYTKTTDAAGSGVTTPGAYDINFPNTWPINTEIFFGNGVYGYRKTGTITAASDERVWTNITTLPAGTTPNLIQSGGWIKWGDEGEHDYKYPVNSAMTNLTGWGSMLGAWSVVRTADQQIALWNTTGLIRTNQPFDVWVTYTK